MENQLQKTLSIFEKALNKLEQILKVPADQEEYVIDATIQRFEFTIELCWKTLKKFLFTEGVECNTPREVLQNTFAAGWIQDETLWINMLKERNLTSHTYQEKLAKEIYTHIKDQYAHELRALHDFLKTKNNLL